MRSPSISQLEPPTKQFGQIHIRIVDVGLIRFPHIFDILEPHLFVEPLIFHRLLQTSLASLLSFVQRGPIGLTASVVDIHWSCHTPMLSPSPTAQPKCAFSRSRPTIIPLQSCDAELGTVQFKKLVEVQYFPFRTLDSRQLGSSSNLQLSLASIASLNHLT